MTYVYINLSNLAFQICFFVASVLVEKYILKAHLPSLYYLLLGIGMGLIIPVVNFGVIEEKEDKDEKNK